MLQAAAESDDLRSFINTLIRLPRVPTNMEMLTQASASFAVGKFDRAQAILNSIGLTCANTRDFDQCLDRELGASKPLYFSLRMRLPTETKESENVDFLRTISEYLPRAQSTLFGVDPIITSIKRKFVSPLLFPKALKRDTALLLYGPPGTGKTKIAEAIPSAFEKSGTKVRLFFVPGGTFKSKWVGATETRIVETYDKLEKEAIQWQKNNARLGVESLSILFVDEIEAIAGKREQEDLSNIVSTLLQVMQGIKTYPHVITIAATNLPWQLDSAIARRFQNSIMVDLPTKETREFIIANSILTVLNQNVEISDQQFKTKQKETFTGSLKAYLDEMVFLTGISSAGIEEFKTNGWLPISPDMETIDKMVETEIAPENRKMPDVQRRHFGWTHDSITKLMDDVFSRIFDIVRINTPKRFEARSQFTFQLADFQDKGLIDSTQSALKQSVNVLDENQYRQLKTYQRYGRTVPPVAPEKKS